MPEEIKIFADDLLRSAVIYSDVYQVLRITPWDAALMQPIPSLVPIRQAHLKEFKINSGTGYRKHPINGDDRFQGVWIYRRRLVRPCRPLPMER
jgi:hypothetical protein